MPYGLYVSAEGAQAQNRRIEVLANNLANVDTVGFKKQFAILQARHSEAIEQGLDYQGSRSINDVGGGTQLEETPTGFAQGAVKHTGINTDLAIDGNGFFQVSDGEQRLLTRAGNFRIAPDGRILTQAGQQVLADDGRAAVIDPSLPFEVLDNGAFQQAGGRVLLSLVKPQSLGDLARVGENTFRPLAEVSPVAAGERRIRSGYLEHANVAPALQMMELIEASRAFEANVSLIQNQDHVLGQLVGRMLRA